MRDRRDITVVTVFGALIRQGRILMIRRAREPYRGLCTIPGGHKLHGESLAEACVREISEETGLRPANPRLIGLMEVELAGDPRDYLSFYFLCREWAGQLAAGPEGELFWADAQTALRLPEAHPAFKALAPFFFNPEEPFLARAQVDARGEGSYRVGGF